MNRAFYWDELERKLDTDLLNQFGFRSSFEKLEEAYNNITGKKLDTTLEFETDPEVWSAVLPRLEAEVETVLHQDIEEDDIAALNKAYRVLKEFEDIVSDLEYVFEEAVVSAPRTDDHQYHTIWIKCNLFEELLNTNVEFRYIDEDYNCVETDSIRVFLHLLPETQWDYIAARKKFYSEIDHELLNLKEISELYKHMFSYYILHGVNMDDTLFFRYKGDLFALYTLNGTVYTLSTDYSDETTDLLRSDVFDPNIFIPYLDELVENQR